MPSLPTHHTIISSPSSSSDISTNSLPSVPTTNTNTNTSATLKDPTPRSPLATKTRKDLPIIVTKREISLQNKNRLFQNFEDPEEYRSWNQIQHDMLAMDKLHDTSFLKWVRDENNAIQVGKNLSTIMSEYSVNKQVSVLKWLFVDWHLQSIIACLNAGILSKDHPTTIPNIICGLCQDWDVKHVAEALALLFFVPNPHSITDKARGENLCIETLKGLKNSFHIHKELCKIIKSHRLLMSCEIENHFYYSSPILEILS